MGKILLWIGGIFTPLGLLFAAIGGWFFVEDRQLAAEGLRAEGQVIELVSVRDSDGGSTYKPVVEFTDADGRTHRFTSSFSSSPPAHSPGERIEVIYLPADPGRAVIDSFLGRHLFPLIFGGIGTLFACIGAVLVLVYFRRRRAVAELRANGVPIDAQFLECYRDTRIAVNHRHPFRIACQAVHPATGQLKRFESDPVWIDPTALIGDTKIRVLVDLRRPDSYLVDLSPWVDESETA